MKRFFPTFIFLIPLLVFASPALSAEIIRFIEIHHQVRERLGDIQAVIRMKEGDVFSQEKVENAIYDLRKWNVFKNVEVLIKHEADGVSLVFELEDAYLIKDVELHGNYPLLENKIRRALFFTTGDVYNPEKIPEQINRLLSFYEKEGYKDTSVLIEESKDETNHMVTLKVMIHKGQSFRVGEVTVIGNTLFPDSRIQNKLYSYISGYSPTRLKSDLEKVEKLYADHGYPRARARAIGFSFNKEKHKVDLTIEIKQGKKVILKFEGNKHQFESRLKKVIGLTETGDTDEFELEHSKNQLISHYHSLGFEEVKVEVEKKEMSDKVILVTFKIHEGPKRVIKSIDFEGNKTFSDKQLRKEMSTKEESLTDSGVFLKPLFDQDLENITSFYQKDGFLEAKITDWKKSLIPTGDKYIIDIDVHEGEQIKVESILFEGLKAFEPKKFKHLLAIKEGSAYSAKRLEEDVRALLVFYSYHAYPYTEIKTEIEEVSPQKTGTRRVKIKYKMVEGPKTKVGKIILVGNLVTSRKTILQALRFREGGPFIPQKILESQTPLRKLGIFDAVSLETLGLKGKEEVVHVVVRVEEKKNKLVELGFTYDTDTNIKGKLTFTRLNLFGLGKKFDLKLTGGPDLNRGELDYTDPRFFGSDWQAVTSGFAQYERRTFYADFQLGASAALLRDLTRFLALVLKYQIARTDFVESETDFNLLLPGSGDNTTGKFQSSLTYDRRDSFGDPKRGYYLSGQMDFATRVQGGNANFFKFLTNLGYWYSPFNRFTIVNLLRTYNILQVSGSGIPTQEKIFLGGDDTIRGFDEDAVNSNGGTVAFVYNLELQMRLIKNFELVAFLDTGSDTDSFSQINLSTFRHSAGPGIRYVTPVGPIRLDYGIILDRTPGENFGRIHFTFGYFF